MAHPNANEKATAGKALEELEGVNGLRSTAAIAMLTATALVAIPYAVPSLWRFRLLTPLPEGAGLVTVPPPAAVAAAASAPVGETALDIETTEQSELRQPEEAPALPPEAAAVLPKGVSEGKPPVSIEDPGGRALDAFFGKLVAAERKDPKAIARITYYGDSIVATDHVTGTMRRKFQRRFGDGGHGFVLIANAWPGYFHNDILRFASPGWKVSRVVGPFAKDGLYGLGGVSFRSDGPGLFSRFGTMKEGSFGRAVSKFVLSYLEHPQGGEVEIRIDGAVKETLSTRADETRSAWKTYELPDGPHELEFRVQSAGVRAFGVWMERDEPGVVLDSIGIQGCRIRFLDQSDDAHWAEQLKRRDPSLTIFHYGLNEAEDGELYPLDQYEATMKAVLVQAKGALSNGSCMLIGPLDRADKRGDRYSSRPVVPKLAAIQRKVAGEVGCAYWDTLTAMGGFGSMGPWVQRGLGAADLAHPSSAGAEVLGNWIYLALMEAYEAYKAKGGPAAASSAAPPAPSAAPPAPK